MAYILNLLIVVGLNLSLLWTSPTLTLTLADQRSDADALCAFKLGIIDWPSSIASGSGWNCNGSTATSFPCGTGGVAWTGIRCGTSAEVRGLDGNSFIGNLNGTISPAIGELTGLTSLNLNSQALSKSIPVDISKLTRLDYLDLSSNSLSGKRDISCYI